MKFSIIFVSFYVIEDNSKQNIYATNWIENWTMTLVFKF